MSTVSSSIRTNGCSPISIARPISCAIPAALVRTLSILPEFLKSRETGQVIDCRDWSVPLGRRFRALKLWFVIRSYGVERLKEMVRAHIDWASELEGRVRDAPDFELTSPRRLALLSFR